MNVSLICDFCGIRFERAEQYVVRSTGRFFCSRKCHSLTRRTFKPEDLKRAEKAVYDRAYREKNAARLKQIKADYFQRTYDPEKARVERQARMPRHVEYCRQPGYRKKKRKYDMKRRALVYGPFADCHQVLLGLERELEKRASKYERMAAKGVLNKCQTRKRALYEKTKVRNIRTHRNQPQGRALGYA